MSEPLPKVAPPMWDRFTLNHGVLNVQYPSVIDPEEIEDVEHLFAFILRQMKRRANRVAEEVEGKP